MQRYLTDKSVLKECKIYKMLEKASKNEHLSFHTPGHKNGAWDITELSFSDNLAEPRGCILEAEKDIAKILGAKRSFILTDGSTMGVFSMLYAAKTLGVKTVAVGLHSHKSVFNACKVLGITPLVYDEEYEENFRQKNRDCEENQEGEKAQIKENDGGMYLFTDIFDGADALFFTSPNYYGEIVDLHRIRHDCDERGKLLLVDGAHGGHLHFDREKYAGAYADLWVDGVHKSLPAFTQGAVVSARTKALGEALKEGVDIFRTSSPSYPIMASVEYAVKYPRNLRLENLVESLQSHERIEKTQDWTKLCVKFGDFSFDVMKELENEGVYPEFCDGEYVVFYLSPATQDEDVKRLFARLKALFDKYPYVAKDKREQIHAPLVSIKDGQTEWVEMENAVDRVCAMNCGLFPPCTPLFCVGERITQEKLELLKKADNVFGVREGKILVAKEATSQN